MEKSEFIGEYGFRASKKMLFPYLSTASGLAQWFADDVNINNENKTFTIIWDGEVNKAKIVSIRTNHHIKFQFLGDDSDPDFLELKIEVNELTEEVFLKVVDYSDIDNEESSEIWDSLIENLKEIIGG